MFVVSRSGLARILISLCLLLPGLTLADETTLDSEFSAKGYDLVSYFQSDPQKGSRKHQVEYLGNTYVFVNAKNAEAFRHEPERFLPAFGSNCAFGMVFGMESDYDPLIYEISQGRLFFMINEGTRRRWVRRPDHYIERGDINWTLLSQENPARVISSRESPQ